ncbi:putative DNA binding domain-containing protein [bacterium]|nr:putative DNA binding domain-containing protein [bacterium]
MALPVNEKELIKGSFVEWERLEYKKGWQPENILHTICAFANDINNWGGGYIIIGIEEKNGQPILPPVGLQKNQIDSIQKKIVEISSKIQPNFTPIVQPYDYTGRHVLIIWVPGGDIRPYKAPDSLGDKKTNFSYYIRKASTTVKAKGVDERRLLGLAQKTPFDDRINHNADVSDLDVQIIKDFLKSVNSGLYKEVDNISLTELGEQMNILRGPKEYKKPVNAGLLFFSKNPENFFRGAVSEVIIYHDDVGDSLSEKILKGPLHIQLKAALEYLQNNVIREEVRKIKGKAEAERFYNYPYEAIEEALANAVYHRSYEMQNTIEVNVRQDKIEIISYPGPLPPIDNKMLKRERIVVRNYRNRRIGDFLKELKFTEGRSTGIPKIRKAMKLNGSPTPVFETDADSNYFLTVLPIHQMSQVGTKSGLIIPKLPRKHQVCTKLDISWDKLKNRLVSSLSQACPKLVPSDAVAEIILITQTPTDLKTIMRNIGETNRTRFKNSFIKPLVKEKIITMTDPDNPTSPNQEYVITEKGKKLLTPIIHTLNDKKLKKASFYGTIPS